MTTTLLIDEVELEFLERLRVGRLATCDKEARPHCVPVCYAWAGRRLWIPLDQKPKSGKKLRRVRNIEANPQVSLVVDHYADNWKELAFLIIEGHARVDSLPHCALAVLRSRYSQYVGMNLKEAISIEVDRTVFWSHS